MPLLCRVPQIPFSENFRLEGSTGQKALNLGATCLRKPGKLSLCLNAFCYDIKLQCTRHGDYRLGQSVIIVQLTADSSNEGPIHLENLYG